MEKLTILQIDPTTIYIIIGAIITLILQLILCFKVNKLIFKLIPIIISFIISVVFVVLLVLSEGWDQLGYLLLALFSGGFALVCILGLIIWIVINIINNKKRNIN